MLDLSKSMYSNRKKKNTDKKDINRIEWNKHTFKTTSEYKTQIRFRESERQSERVCENKKNIYSLLNNKLIIISR